MLENIITDVERNIIWLKLLKTASKQYKTVIKQNLLKQKQNCKHET